MKKLIILLLLCATSFAAEENDFYCASCDSFGTVSYANGVGGKYFTSSDSVHALAVFIEFPDDNYDTTNTNWIKGQAPAYLNKVFDQPLPSHLCYPCFLAKHGGANYIPWLSKNKWPFYIGFT